MEWMLMPYRRYAEFSGRSRRNEYWMFMLLVVIIEAVLLGLMFGAGFSAFAALGGATAVDRTAGLSGIGPLLWIVGIVLVVWGLATIIPSIALAVRRLHDRNMSGWYLVGLFVAVLILSRLGSIGSLLTFVVEIGWLVLMALPGTQGPNKYGPDPLGRSDAEVFA